MSIKKLGLVFGLAAAATASAAISYSPVTAGATEGAQKLYNFLATNYGIKTVSGVMTGDVNSATVKELPDVASFNEHSGKSQGPVEAGRYSGLHLALEGSQRPN